MPDETAPQRYAALPEPVRLADTTPSQPASAAPDPTMGRDPETEFMLRYL
ncbi:heme biosynthesis protein HemY [Cellulomonas fimi]|nr:heme biosynthesis protein HemY [Cellulomonas fimi]